MAKTKEELDQIKKDINALASEISELSEKELEAITGGTENFQDFWEILKKMGKGIESVTKPVVKP